MKEKRKKTISQIHKIWLKTKERKARFAKEFADFISYITTIDELKCDNGSYKIYCDVRKNHVMMYDLKKDLEGNIDFTSGSIDMNLRINKTLRFTNTIAFEVGNEFWKKKTMYEETYLDERVFSKLYTEVMISIKDIKPEGRFFEVKIDDKIYLLERNQRDYYPASISSKYDRHTFLVNDFVKYDYTRHSWLGEMKNNIIQIS